MIGIGVTPLVIHQPNTVEICGNETYTPSPSPSDYEDWSHAVYNQLFYYIVTQAALSIVLLLVIILGEIYFLIVIDAFNNSLLYK